MKPGAAPEEMKIAFTAGQPQTFSPDLHATLVFDFDPQHVVFDVEGGDLYITSPSGDSIIIEGFSELAESGSLGEFVFIDGTVVPGDIFLMSLGSEETAAQGQAAGGGSSEYLDDPGQLLDGLDADGGLSLTSQEQELDDGVLLVDDVPPLFIDQTSGTTEAPYEIVTFDGYETSPSVYKGHLLGYRWLNGTDADEILVGEDENSLLLAGRGNDLLVGGPSGDNLNGGPGDDTLWGGGGDDTMFAGAGDDVVYASTGKDYVLLDNGHDTVIVQENALGDGNSLTVRDYDIGVDAIDVRGNVEISEVEFHNGYTEVTVTNGQENYIIQLNGAEQQDFEQYLVDHANSPADDLIQFMIDSPQLFG